MPEENKNTGISDTLRDQLNELLSNTNLSGVTAEGSGFSDLPVGYYLCEVKKASLGESKSSHRPMVSLQLSVVNDGYAVNENEDDSTLVTIPHSKGRMVFVHYPFSDQSSVQRFASDMLKFEGTTPGEPLLEKDAWISVETMEEALSVLEDMGSRIWINVHEGNGINPNTGKNNIFNSLISWKRAAQLGLPVDEE